MTRMVTAPAESPAIIPPTVQVADPLGSGPRRRPSGASVALSSATTTPGCSGA